jgi:hypothetical protein
MNDRKLREMIIDIGIHAGDRLSLGSDHTASVDLGGFGRRNVAQIARH